MTRLAVRCRYSRGRSPGCFRILSQSLPDPPDVGPKLAIGHLNSVELKRLPDLVHLSATAQACLDLGPSPHDPPAVGPRSCRGKGAKVREVGSGFSRIAAAVHGSIVRRSHMECNDLSTLCQHISRVDFTATVCQQSVNGSAEQPAVGWAKTPVVEHKGVGMQTFFVLVVCLVLSMASFGLHFSARASHLGCTAFAL